MRIVDDIQLKRALKGDGQAMDAVISACMRPVYNICLRVLGNAQDAEDAAQEALLKIFKGLAAFRGDSEFSSWVYRIATNASLDCARRRSNGAVGLEDAAAQEIQDAAKGPGELFADAALAEEINECLHALDFNHREVLLLREYGGYSYQEIADRLGLEVGTVKSRIARARAALRAELETRKIL